MKIQSDDEPKKVQQVPLKELRPGDTFYFSGDYTYEDAVRGDDAAGIYMVSGPVKDERVTVINLNNGLLLSRDGDRKVTKVDATLKVSPPQEAA